MQVYKTVYKERQVYVPVYDDPFWNPEADGRVAGEVSLSLSLSLHPLLSPPPSD